MATARRQRGTGTIREYPHRDGDVSFRIQYRDASGKQVPETLGRASEGWTRHKAEDELRERINRVRKQGYRKPKPMLFEDYADRWLNAGERRNSWKASTVKTYRFALGHLKKRFGRMRLSEIRRTHINDFTADLIEQGLGARTANLLLNVLHGILASALEEELIDRNPAVRVRRPKAARYKPHPLTSEECRLVEGTLKDEQVKLAFVTFELLGLRFIELRGLRWRDVYLNEKKLRIADSKAAKGERVVPMPSVLVDRFMEHYQRTHYKADSDYVFCHPEKGSKWHPHHYRDAVKAALKEVGIEGTFRQAHDMRVTSITRGVLAGEHPAKLMDRAGHTSFQTTRIYIDLAGAVSHDETEALAKLSGFEAPVEEEAETE
jgi:integrase